MTYQVSVKHEDDDRVWDSIRDSENEALYQVAEYMLKDSDSAVAYHGRCIHNRLAFGACIEAIEVDLFDNMGFTLTIKHIAKV